MPDLLDRVRLRYQYLKITRLAQKLRVQTSLCSLEYVHIFTHYLDKDDANYPHLDEDN